MKYILIYLQELGSVPEGRNISPKNCEDGDAIIVSGTLGDHHATILSSRLNIKNSIVSDCAPLNEMVTALYKNNIKVKAMRDVTRGGLATILNEIANASKNCIEDRRRITANIKTGRSILRYSWFRSIIYLMRQRR